MTRLFWEPDHLVFWAGMAFLGFLQVTAFVLNMLPVPGLDGYSALEPHLSPQTQRALQPAKQWAFLILLLLLFTPQVNRWFFEMVFWFFDLSGVPRGLIWARHGSHPVLVRLVLTAPCDICVFTHRLQTWVPDTITAMPTPVSAGWSSPPRS